MKHEETMKDLVSTGVVDGASRPKFSDRSEESVDPAPGPTGYYSHPTKNVTIPILPKQVRKAPTQTSNS